MVGDDMLVCDECLDSHRARKRSYIDTTECEFIDNVDGVLVCKNVKRMDNYDAFLPVGEYLASCGGCKMLESRSILACDECMDLNKIPHYSATNAVNCADIVNTNGVLSCITKS